MLNFPLNSDKYEEESNMIKHITKSNGTYLMKIITSTISAAPLVQVDELTIKII